MHIYDDQPMTDLAVYDLSPGTAVDLGPQAQVRYVWGTEDRIRVRHGGRTYTLTRGAWIRGTYGTATLSLDRTTGGTGTVAIETGLRVVDAIPAAPGVVRDTN